nr:MAG TPA: hypothetical protein [Caudoviricetes sp.]
MSITFGAFLLLNGRNELTAGKVCGAFKEFKRGV